MKTQEEIIRNNLQKMPNIQSLKNKAKNKRCLIIGNGLSAGDLLEQKNEIRKKFDCIFVFNKGIESFGDIADYWVSIETHVHTMPWITTPCKCPLVCHAKIAHKIKKEDKIVALRCPIDFLKSLNSSRVIDGLYKGLYGGMLNGPVLKTNEIKVTLGSVLLQTVHLTSIMGINEVYMSGVEMFFKDDVEHFYKDQWYTKMIKDKKSPTQINKFVYVERDGKKLKTIEFFEKSAIYIDEIIQKLHDSFGMNFYSLCDESLLQRPVKALLKDIK